MFHFYFRTCMFLAANIDKMKGAESNIMKTLGTKRIDVKKHNRGQILKLIATRTCNNRVELVARMGLTKMAITNMVSELSGKGLVREGDVGQCEGVGRNPINLRIPESAPGAIGILILRDRCEAVLCDFYLNVRHRRTVLLHEPDKRELISILYGLVEAMLEYEKNILGIGISCIGPIDFDRGMILNPPYFYEIHDIPVASLLEDRYSLPVFMDHDNQSAALAELLYGNGKNRDSFMLLGIARGVGCGIVKNGMLYVDSRKLAPEVGHVSIDYKGKRCICGNRGCLELYVNTDEILGRLRKATGQALSFEGFCKSKETQRVCEIFEDMTEKIRSALVSTVNLLNLDLILLGYDGVHLPEKYVKQLEDGINEFKLAKDRSRTGVKKAYFGEDSQLLGAVCNVLNQVYEGKLLLD